MLAPDGRDVFATIAGASGVQRWNLATDQLDRVPLPRNSTWIRLGLDGAHIATTFDLSVVVWDLAHPDLVHTIWLSGPPGLPRSLAFDPGATRLVTATAGTSDRSVRIWNAASGAPVATPLFHPEPLKLAVFSPHGRRVLTTSQDNSARVWDVATGKPITSPLTHGHLLMTAAFGHDGDEVVTVTRDRVLHRWDIAPYNGAPTAWADLAARSPFQLRDGVLQERTGATDPRAVEATPPAGLQADGAPVE